MAPNIFFTADLHLGHSNIIKYCNRPFQTVEEMNEKLIQNWNDTVSDKDDIYVVGDFAFMGTKQTEEFLKQLKGRKYLLRGNHDKSLNETMALKYFKWIKDFVRLPGDTTRFPLAAVTAWLLKRTAKGKSLSCGICLEDARQTL